MSYVLPVRSSERLPDELVGYLAFLAARDQLAEIIVVDASGPAVFEDLEARRPPRVRHVGVDPAFQGLANGKVAGVLTGVNAASHPYVIVADEDVRYDEGALDAMRHALDAAEIVRPQNYFDPLPWHACLDSARTLINRVTGGDWPGTLGLRRSILQRTGGYDGNVLFENLELVRTVRAAGGREFRPLNLFVRRLPPRTHHFWSQRVRQAYDEFARPARLAAWLALVPTALAMAGRFGRWALIPAVLGPMLVAEAGRRRGQGVRVFPPACTLAAPVWVLERGVCAWAAVVSRLVIGGVPYHGRVLRRAATPYRTLARIHGASSPELPSAVSIASSAVPAAKIHVETVSGHAPNAAPQPDHA